MSFCCGRLRAKDAHDTQTLVWIIIDIFILDCSLKKKNSKRDKNIIKSLFKLIIMMINELGNTKKPTD